jgi:hypothetical protein
MYSLKMIKVFAGKVRKTGFSQKAGLPGNSEKIFGIFYKSLPAAVRRMRSQTSQNCETFLMMRLRNLVKPFM